MEGFMTEKSMLERLKKQKEKIEIANKLTKSTNVLLKTFEGLNNADNVADEEEMKEASYTLELGCEILNLDYIASKISYLTRLKKEGSLKADKVQQVLSIIKQMNSLLEETLQEEFEELDKKMEEL